MNQETFTIINVICTFTCVISTMFLYVVFNGLQKHFEEVKRTLKND